MPDDHAPAGPGICALCCRPVAELTTHHLIPRARHRRRRTRREHGLAELKARTVELCRPCHGNLHARISEAELERTASTLADLGRHPEVAPFTAWIRTRPDGIRLAFTAQRR